MDIVFRVDSSNVIGSGHVVRCLTLADSLRKRTNSKIVFVCRNHLGHIGDEIISRGYDLKLLTKQHVKGGFKQKNICDYEEWLGNDWESDAEETISTFGSNKIDLLIVDHYGIDFYWHKKLQKYTKKLMVIDDLANRKYDCDILLDQTFNRYKDAYYSLVPKHCKILVNTKYALLRPEFYKNRDFAIKKRREPFNLQHILISVGGGDSDNLSGEILENILEIEWDYPIIITIVLGWNSKHKLSLEQIPHKKLIEVNILENISNISELMISADIAIGAGGATTWERCCVGLPSLVFITAKNQEESSLYLDSIGAIDVIKNMSEIKEKIIALKQGRGVDIGPMIRTSLSICDGVGSERVVDEIMGF